MAHGHAHEEAEHAEHHSQDPFTKRVALSMVVIAALLATVKLFGHRTHNEVLAEQIRADTSHTEESDSWNRYQAQRLRAHIYNAEVINRGGKDSDENSEESLVAPKEEKLRKVYEDKRSKAEGKAKEEKKYAEEKKKEAEKHNDDAEHAHHRANYLDAAELFVEIGLVLCSVAILMTRTAFWYGGMVVSAVGGALTALAYIVY
jgi:hypothetical protein